MSVGPFCRTPLDSAIHGGPLDRVTACLSGEGVLRLTRARLAFSVWDSWASLLPSVCWPFGPRAPASSRTATVPID
jgi:hypothetical protein